MKFWFISTFFLFFYGFVFSQEKALNYIDFVKSGRVESSISEEKIPFEIWNDFILLHIKINGKDATMIWDNGTSVTAIDSTFSTAFGLTSKDTLTLIDGNNVPQKVSISVINQINIGNCFLVKDTPFAVFNSRFLSENTDRNIHGLLGASVINKLNWSFDFDKNELLISEKAIETTSEQPIQIQITDDNSHYVLLEINNTEMYAQIDFGNNGEALLGDIALKEVFKNHKVTAQYGINGFSVGGVSNVDTTYFIKNYNFGINGNIFKNPPAIALSKLNNGLICGNRFFRRFNVIYNAKDSTIFLLNRRTKSKPESLVSFQIKIFLFENKLLVGKINLNDQQKYSEIKVFDEVKSINGRVAQMFTNNSDVLSFQNELLNTKKRMNVTMKNGRTYSLKPVF